MARKAEELRALVPVMRELGVVEYDGIKLVPPSPKAERIELTEDEIYERETRLRDMRHETLFAASTIRPILRHPPRSPDSVVQRAVSARGRGSGEAE